MTCTFPALRCSMVSVLLMLIFSPGASADVNLWETILEPTEDVKDLICDPDITNRMYAIVQVQFENGPRYYLPAISENEGRTWQTSYNGLGIDPEPNEFYNCRLFSSPSEPYILYFVVRDQFNNFSRIYRSIDKGITWSSWSAVDAEIQTVGISPIDTNIWIAGGQTIDDINGLFRSVDTGKTWDFVFDTGSNGIHRHVEFSKSNPNTIVICKSSEFIHLIKSTDNGLSWEVLPTLNWGWNSSWDVTIHPTNPEIMVAAVMGPPRWSHFLRRTTDGGQTWSLFGPEETDDVGSGGAMAVHYDMRNPDNIYVVKNSGDILWRSVNGGDDWELTIQDVGGTYTQKNNVYVRLIESPWSTNTVYTNVAGAYVSRDKGHTWEPTGQTSSDVLYVHPTDSNYIFSACHQQSLFRSSDHGNTWHSAATGIPFLYKVAENNKICASSLEPQNLWISCERSAYCGGGSLDALFRSTDYGTTWEMLPDVPGDSIETLTSSRHASTRVFCIVSDIVDSENVNYRFAVSDDSGFTWREIFIPDATSLATFAEHNTDPNIWMVAGKDASGMVFFRSMDEGTTWRKFGKESGYNPWEYGYVKKILTDPDNDSRLYLDNFYVIGSEDLGETWRKLEGVPCGYGFLFDPRCPQVLYCSGYRSVDGGSIWTDKTEFFTVQFDSLDQNVLYKIDHSCPK